MSFHQGLLLLLVGLTFLQKSYGQDRCGFDAYQEKLLQQNPRRSEKNFEQWMKEKIRIQKFQNFDRKRTESPTYTIPVVVHVIHNGEPIGVGKNISNAQVQSQINVLNQDYQRLNADTVNTPSQFSPAAGSIDIQFVLAKQDPDGLPTNGILRVQGTKPSWNFNDAFDSFGFKSLSYWPAEDYLNIWVIAFSDGYLGVAQFPISSLPGVEGPYDSLTDGVVVDYTAFGTADAGSFNLDPQYDKGRTTTHEIGHYFSMLHVFGKENGCSNTTDYVDDTPSQDTKTLNCPSHPSLSCGHPKMFQNYLDYTDDACMNLFTSGQMDRMVTVLENSPRRNSLLSSPGAIDPVLLSLDLESKKVLAPTTNTCGQSITPKLEIRNRGTTKITAARIQFLLNSIPVETLDFSLDLDQLEIVALSFGQINLAEPSTNTVSFQVVEVNGGPDENTSNDFITLSTQVASRITPPLVEVFNSTPSSWQLLNPDNNVAWQNVIAPKSVPSNRAMTIELYNYSSMSAKDQLISPVINLMGADFPVLRFDHAYARFPGNSKDSLRILALQGCSNDISQAVEIYRKGGTELSTSGNTSISFKPSNETQWESSAIQLSPFTGQNVQLIFESINGNGNNLYIDNVQVQIGDFFDVAVSSLISPGPVLCLQAPSPVLQVQNLGSDQVTRIEVTTQVNGVTSSIKMFNNLNLLTGSANDVTLDPVTLIQGENSIVFSVHNPDTGSDEFPENNTLDLKWNLNDRKELVPHRQNFEMGLGDWTIINQGTQKEWEMKDTNFGSSLVYKAFTNTIIAEEAWLVSPVLDFSSAIEASLFVETSYANRSAGSERLRILASEDCGIHYNQVLFDKMGDQLANETISSQWLPVDEGDWRTEYLNLNDLAGKGNVRFAFVITNDNGNDLYIDNIEWYIDDNPNPPKIADFFSVYYGDSNPYDIKVTFNLPEKDLARLTVFNAMGQVLIDNLLPETLNQTYTIDLAGQSTGVYIARLQAGGKIGTTKLFVGR